VYNGEKVAIGNIYSLMFLCMFLIMFFYKMKKQVFMLFYFLFTHQCFNIYEANAVSIFD